MKVVIWNLREDSASSPEKKGLHGLFEAHK